MASRKDYYEILGLERDASKNQIKKAYKKLAAQQPGKNADASATGRSNDINEAYEVLSDENKKARYDRYGYGSDGANPRGGILASARRMLDETAVSIQSSVPWLKRYLNYPDLGAFIKDESGGNSINESIPIIITAQIISFFSLGIAFGIAAILEPSKVLPVLGQLLLSLMLMDFLAGILIFYLSSLAIFLFARLFGAQGGMGPQLRLMAIATVCSNILSAPLAVLNVILMDNTQAALPVMVVLTLVGFYELYVFYVILRKVHSLSLLRAAASLALGLIVIFVGMELIGGFIS